MVLLKSTEPQMQLDNYENIYSKQHKIYAVHIGSRKYLQALWRHVSLSNYGTHF